MELNFKDFLYRNNFLPLEADEWKMITVDHTSFNSKVVTSQIREHLRGYTKGIYVYTNLQNEVYYVGQGKLKGRVIKKYKQAISESNEIPSPRGLFFRSKKEVLNVYVRNVENYMEQIALEAMLSNVLKPKYLDFLQEFNVYKKAGKLEELFNKLR
ncbi:hypothetical protein V7138_24930 [Bacillus sp. JJ1533]|uniref:hypothetical protein n=1 Tax=Bacillus sp. JJ1533 TaxID=3122959 RepID=UPI00300020D5